MFYTFGKTVFATHFMLSLNRQTKKPSPFICAGTRLIVTTGSVCSARNRTVGGRRATRGLAGEEEEEVQAHSSMAISEGISDQRRAYFTGVTCSWGSRSTCMCSMSRQKDALRS